MIIMIIIIIIIRAVEPAVYARTHCNSFTTDRSCWLSLFVLTGSWDIKGGSCETDPAGNWRAGGSAVVDTPRHGKLPFTEEWVFRANYHTPHACVCERLWEAWHRTAPHRRSSYVLRLSSACWCPRWSTDTGSTVHDSTQNPFLHSLFLTDFLCSSSHAWDGPFFPPFF